MKRNLIIIIPLTFLFIMIGFASHQVISKNRKKEYQISVAAQKVKEELKENIVNFSTEMVTSQVQYINSRKEIIKLLKMIENNQWTDTVVKYSLKSTDLSEISDEAKKAMESFNKSLDFLIQVGPVSDDFNNVLFRYKKILNNNYLFTRLVDDGDIYPSNLKEWISDVKEADIIIEMIDLEMKKIVDKIK